MEGSCRGRSKLRSTAHRRRHLGALFVGATGFLGLLVLGDLQRETDRQRGYDEVEDIKEFMKCDCRGCVCVCVCLTGESAMAIACEVHVCLLSRPLS
jgi:hypothetical protein